MEPPDPFASQTCALDRRLVPSLIQVDVALSLVEVYSEGSASQIRDLLVSGTPRVHIRAFALDGATEVPVADAARLQVTHPAI